MLVDGFTAQFNQLLITLWFHSSHRMR